MERVEIKSQGGVSRREFVRLLVGLGVGGTAAVWGWTETLNEPKGEPYLSRNQLLTERGSLLKNLRDTRALVPRGWLGSDFVDPADPRNKQLNLIDQQLDDTYRAIIEKEGPIVSRLKLFPVLVITSFLTFISVPPAIRALQSLKKV